MCQREIGRAPQARTDYLRGQPPELTAVRELATVHGEVTLRGVGLTSATSELRCWLEGVEYFVQPVHIEFCPDGQELCSVRLPVQDSLGVAWLYLNDAHGFPWFPVLVTDCPYVALETCTFCHETNRSTVFSVEPLVSKLNTSLHAAAGEASLADGQRVLRLAAALGWVSTTAAIIKNLSASFPEKQILECTGFESSLMFCALLSNSLPTVELVLERCDAAGCSFEDHALVKQHGVLSTLQLTHLKRMRDTGDMMSSHCSSAYRDSDDSHLPASFSWRSTLCDSQGNSEEMFCHRWQHDNNGIEDSLQTTIDQHAVDNGLSSSDVVAALEASHLAESVSAMQRLLEQVNEDLES